MKFGGILETAARNAFLSCFAGSVANQAYFLLLARVKTSIEHFGTHRREAHVRKMKFFFGAGGGGEGAFCSSPLTRDVAHFGSSVVVVILSLCPIKTNTLV